MKEEMRMRLRVLILIGGLCVASGVPATTAAAAPAKAAAQGAKYDEAKLKTLEAKLSKQPKDAKLKQQVAEANFQVGHAMMINPELPPRVKYRGALKLFRRALALNPKHAGAAADRKQIEDIYTQMGMPIPQ